MTAVPFSLRIFVADGDPDGLRIVERSNWVGRALVFPRAAWAQPSVANRAELQQTGVYLLLGPREDGEGDRLFIGEGDPIQTRLNTGASAHDAGLKGRIKRATCKSPPGQLARCLLNSQKLGMPAWVERLFLRISCDGNELVLVDHERPNGDLSRVGRSTRLIKGSSHPIDILRQGVVATHSST
jgi:hypothetical protein